MHVYIFVFSNVCVYLCVSACIHAFMLSPKANPREPAGFKGEVADAVKEALEAFQANRNPVKEPY